MSLTDKEIAEARALCEAATPGPLFVLPHRGDSDCWISVAPTGKDALYSVVAESCLRANAELFAVASTLVLKLLDEVVELREQVDNLVCEISEANSR